jgi:cyclohexanone monooxygenase
MENFTNLTAGSPAEDEDLIQDGWTDVLTKFLRSTTIANNGKTAPADAVERADFAKMEQLRARIDTTVADPVTAEALKPWYRQFCKRPCFHDQYLPAFNRANVTLVDTGGKGVERITESGVVVAGSEYPIDCLVLATGFEIGTSYTRRSGYDVIGTGGQRLSEKWAKGFATLHGMHVHGFPNLFVFNRDQSSHTVNFTHSLDEISRHVAHILAEVRERGGTRVEATAEAEADWVATIIELSALNRDFLESCTPGFYNGEGRMNEAAARQGAGYGGGPDAFFKVLAQWRDRGDLAGLEIGA